MLSELRDLANGVNGGNIEVSLSAPLAGYAFRVARKKGIDLRMRKIGGVFHCEAGELVRFVNDAYGYPEIKIPDPEIAVPDIEEVSASDFEDEGDLSSQDEEILDRDGPVEFVAPLPAGARASNPGPGGLKNLPNTAKSPKDRSTNDEGGGNNMRDATDGVGSGRSSSDSVSGRSSSADSGAEKAIDPTDPDAPKPHAPKLPPKK